MAAVHRTEWRTGVHPQSHPAQLHRRGQELRDSYFSASSCSIGRLRPGHLNYPVDGRGVIFSGRTREPICTGLTRPHSARLQWKAGLGGQQRLRRSRLRVQTAGCRRSRRLPGWTRGLCLVGDIAFVGTSRVIPRYARYAPGLDVRTSRCAVHADQLQVRRTAGQPGVALRQPDLCHRLDRPSESTGFPFEARARKQSREIAFFYTLPDELSIGDQ